VMRRCCSVYVFMHCRPARGRHSTRGRRPSGCSMGPSVGVPRRGSPHARRIVRGDVERRADRGGLARAGAPPGETVFPDARWAARRHTPAATAGA
jgi:hypothetical protein